MATKNAEAIEAANRTYEWGFHSDIEQDFAPKGLTEDTVRFISAKKGEPAVDARLAAEGVSPVADDGGAGLGQAADRPDRLSGRLLLRRAQGEAEAGQSLDEVDPEILRVYEKLGIPIEEQKVLAGVEGARTVAVDAVFDSVSVATTFRKELESAGVIFRSISEAIKEYPDLVRKWLGKVVPMHDNYFATLNCAVFSRRDVRLHSRGRALPDGAVSTYFRINAENTGQFERTLIVADKGSYVSYLEGCTAPMRDENQLHAAVVELVALDDAEIKYSTVQNWYPGDENGKGGIYNFVTKRALCQGRNSKVSWTQVETGSAITWKYPSCVLNGENSVGEFYSVAVTNNRQQADTGTKMIHNGKRSRSTIVSKGISAGRSDNTYRGLVRVGAERGGRAQLHPVRLPAARRPVRRAYRALHRGPQPAARRSSMRRRRPRFSDDQMFYAMQRGLDSEEAVALIVNGFAQGSAAAAADGIRGRGAEAAGDFARGAVG